MAKTVIISQCSFWKFSIFRPCNFKIVTFNRRVDFHSAVIYCILDSVKPVVRCYRFTPFLSFLVWPHLPTHCRYRVNVASDHIQGHMQTRQDSSGRGIGPSQRHLRDNTQHSQPTYMPPAGFETAIPASERPQSHALNRAATVCSNKSEWSNLLLFACT
jgi:hypothetical protein